MSSMWVGPEASVVCAVSPRENFRSDDGLQKMKVYPRLASDMFGQ